MNTTNPDCRNCPICDLPPLRSDLIGHLPDTHHRVGRDEYALTYCACGELIYLSPVPEKSDLRAMYSDQTQFDQKEVYGSERREEIRRFYEGCLRRILSQMHRREDEEIRVLEIGAGLAWMCGAAKSLNERSLTIAQDISSEAAQSCPWVDEYLVSDLFSCEEIEEKAPYDLVSLTHVIEHLADPSRVLQRISRWVSSGGIVFITAPHRPNGWTRGGELRNWRDWSYGHVPGHLQYFSQGSMEKAATLAGLEVLLWDGDQEEGQAFEAWLRPEAPKNDSMIHSSVRQEASRHRKEFSEAKPFRHVIIDGFLAPERAEQLWSEFPPFTADNARNEFGVVGTKATMAEISRISFSYAELYRYLGSREFLEFVTRLTNIPNLLHDEQMFGGGTHENLEGDELDPHVDFNYIEDRKLHRRLNLLVYLNKEWDNRWGGALELHSNPRRPAESRIKTITPVFNRCVIFETNEYSWHGFQRIRLPSDKKHLSRKLISVYLYTRERPAEEVAPPHGTFYVQRPLPETVAAGTTLSEEDVRELSALLVRRDGRIEYYQGKEIEYSRQLQEFRENADRLRREVEDLRERLAALQVEFDQRGVWALSLDEEIHQQREYIARLQAELQSPTLWLKRLLRLVMRR